MENGYYKHPSMKGWWQIWVNNVDIAIMGSKKDAKEEYERELAKQSRRRLHEIALEIKEDWKNIYFGAVPYLSVMMQLESIENQYGEDRGEDIVRYFLVNAVSWRGPKAREIKKELNEMIR